MADATTQPTISADLLEPLVLQPGRTLEEIEYCIHVASAGAGIRHRALAFYLQEVDSRGLHQLRGFRTTTQYAAQRFDIARREARDLLAAGRVLLELPLIDAAFAGGEVCWSKVRELIKVASPQHEAKWLERAQALHIDELINEVRLSKPGEAPRNRDDRKGLPEIRLWIHAQVPPDVQAKWDLARKKIQDESGRTLKDWEFVEAMCDLALASKEDCLSNGGSAYCVVINSDGGAMSVETEDGPVPLDDLTAEMIACDCGCIEPGMDDEEADRRVPVALRHRVLARDGCRCRCCGSRHRLQMHHIRFFSDGGPTSFDNLITLCRSCHALIHAKLLFITGDLDSGWRFRDDRGRDLHAPGSVPARTIEAMVRECRQLVFVPPARPAVPNVVAETPSQVGTMCQPCPGVRLSDVVGQDAVVASLRMAVRVALKRDQPLGHVLLCGAAGLGKTTLARAVAGELGTRVHTTTATLLDTPQAMVDLLRGLARHNVLFIDEIHGLPARVAEVLYEALTDRRLSLPTSVLQLPPFTLMGATTDRGALPHAFLSRFQHLYLDFYGESELAELIRRAADREGVPIDEDASACLARVSRGTPREALRLYGQAQGEAIAAGADRVDESFAQAALARLGIDALGLDPMDRRYLGALRIRPGRPIALWRLAALLGESPRTLERLHEPYIFRLGLATTTPRGRVALNC